MAVEDELAAFIVETDLDDVPDRTVEFTKHLLAKTVVGTVAGSRTPSGEMILEYVGGNAHDGSTRVLGTDVETSPEDAALAMGYFSHAAELEDDQFPVAASDITVVPVVFALADHLGLSGEAVLESTAVAMEVMNRVSAFPVTHLGFTDLPFYGVVGAQAAAAKCHGFDRERTKATLGLGIAQSSGWRMNFGTAAHYWESAVPCQNAISSAELAALGGDSNPDIESWLSTLLDRDIDADRITRDLGEEWRIHETCIKKYPVCFLTHRQLDVLGELLESRDVAPEDVESIETDVGPVDEVVDRPEPTSVDDARFSLQHVLAVYLRNGGISYGDLQPDAIEAPEIASLRSKVEVTVHDEWPAEFNSGIPEVRITTTDGEVIASEREHLVGGPHEPLSEGEMRDLCTRLFTGYYEEPLLSEAGIERTIDTVFALEEEATLDGLFEVLTDETG
jgi:2-methylcitrate dehydratase PrpD